MSKPNSIEDVKKEYLDVNSDPLHDEKLLHSYKGKDVVIYDEHHGTAIRARKVTVPFLMYYLDGSSTIIVLN